MQKTYTMQDISFIGGDTQTLEVSLFNESKRRVGTDRIEAILTVTESINRYGPPILTKAGVVEPDTEDVTLSHFTFYLSEADTQGLSNKYIYQIVLRDQGGNTEVYQGFLNIQPNIDTQLSLPTSFGGAF